MTSIFVICSLYMFHHPENKDPVACMLGDRFATVDGADNSIYRFIEEITKEIEILAKVIFLKILRS